MPRALLVPERHVGPGLKSVGLGLGRLHVMRRIHSSLMNEIHEDPKLVADRRNNTFKPAVSRM